MVAIVKYNNTNNAVKDHQLLKKKVMLLIMLVNIKIKRIGLLLVYHHIYNSRKYKVKASSNIHKHDHRCSCNHTIRSIALIITVWNRFGFIKDIHYIFSVIKSFQFLTELLHFPLKILSPFDTHCF